VHGVILGTMAVGYAVLAVAAWPPPPEPARGKVEQGLSVLVGVGHAAAAGAIVMGGVCLLLYAALSTALLGRFRNPWLVHGIAIGLGVIAIAIVNW